MDGQRGSTRVFLLTIGALIVLASAYVYAAARRSEPAVQAVQPSAAARTAVPAGKPLAWPAGVQAAVGVAGSPIMQTNGKQAGKPTASTAKLITVLCVLQKRPLALGQQGPVITLTQNDVNIYNAYFVKDGSLVPVKAGEKITEYQMLETILLPSANNMADSLAIWAFGSLNNYSAYANDYVRSLGLMSTHVGPDASGFNPATVSSAEDLLQVGKIAMSNPVLSQIVGKPAASGIPIAGTIRNVNFLLGTSDIIGVKTGDTDQAGGVFVGAANKQINGKRIVLVTSVVGTHDIFSVLKDSLTLIRSVQSNFKPVTVIGAGTIVGHYNLPWGGSVQAVADQNLTLEGWAGSSVPFTVKLDPINVNAQAGQTVGTITVNKSAFNDQKTIDLELSAAPTKPSLGWRLLHPL